MASVARTLSCVTRSDRDAMKGSNGVWLTAGIIIADVVGAGILGMPSAVAQFGWALGSVVMAVMLAANVHISLLLWRVRMGCAECSGAAAYIDVAKGVFANAPAWQRHCVVGVTGASQYSFMFGVLGIYLLSAGKGLGMLFYKFQMCLPTWAMLAALLLLPFAVSARRMGTFQSLVWVNVGTLCGTICIPLGYYAINGVQDIRPDNSTNYAFSPLTQSGVLSALSTFTFGMTSQFILTEIISEMKDPAELPKAYALISAPFQLVAFLVAGVGGYMFIGDEVHGMINENLPFGYAFQVAALCLVTHMLISYLIKGVVWCKALHTSLDVQHAHSDENSVRSWAVWSCIVTMSLLSAYMVANLVPFFGDFVDVLGASFTPLSCWIIPIMLFVRWYGTSDEVDFRVSNLEWTVIALEIGLALVLMILGTQSAMDNIVSHWHTYGYPFACHCESIWASCECSPARMEIQGACNISAGNL